MNAVGAIIALDASSVWGKAGAFTVKLLITHHLILFSFLPIKPKLIMVKEEKKIVILTNHKELMMVTTF